MSEALQTGEGTDDGRVAREGRRLGGWGAGGWRYGGGGIKGKGSPEAGIKEKSTPELTAELRNCVKVEVAALGS